MRAWHPIVAATVVMGCSSTSGPLAVNLAPAREALEAARQAGAPERAPETFGRAESQLKEAERLSQSREPHAATEAVRAEGTARLAQVEARCAGTRADELRTQAEKGTQEQERLGTRLRRAEEDQRRLEEQVALLKRDLEDTETEVIRTKARIKGMETKAEASSAIAEARILTRRLDPKTRGTTLTRCQELLTKAEQQMQSDNFGAAVFFALKAQDMAVKPREGLPPPGRTEPAAAERPAPKASYLVRVESVNLRQGPSLSEAVVARAPRGATLHATVMRGDWLKVSWASATGWVHLSLVE